MERKKSVLACILISITMLFLALPTYATNGGSSPDSGTNPSPVISVTLPTMGYKFTIDPYGVTAIEGSGKSLEEVMTNPLGLVTSEALEIKNTDTNAGVQVDVELSLSSQSQIKIAKTEEEAKSGQADLYLQILPTAGFADWAPTPVTVLEDGSSQGNQLSFHLEKSGEEHDTYEYMIDGYANPNAEIWKTMASTQDTVDLNMKFTFKPDEVEETSEETPSETESSSEEEPSSEDSSDSSSESSSGEISSGETTTVPKPATDVNYANGTFELRIKKSEVSAKPTAIHMVYLGKSYDLEYYSWVQIMEEGDEYRILVQEFEGAGAKGTCELVVYAGNTVIYDEATITIP